MRICDLCQYFCLVYLFFLFQICFLMFYVISVIFILIIFFFVIIVIRFVKKCLIRYVFIKIQECIMIIVQNILFVFFCLFYLLFVLLNKVSEYKLFDIVIKFGIIVFMYGLVLQCIYFYFELCIQFVYILFYILCICLFFLGEKVV